MQVRHSPNSRPPRASSDAGSGTLALAITAHPDFDDTPLFDEDADGDPTNDGALAELTVPLDGVTNLAFDGVTAEFAVNEAGESPLLCVTRVHDAASGDLSLPGRLGPPR